MTTSIDFSDIILYNVTILYRTIYKLFNDLSVRLNDYEIAIKIPRLANSQKYRVNILAKECFKIIIDLFLFSNRLFNNCFVNLKNII